MLLMVLIFVGPLLGLDLLSILIGWPTRQVFQALVL
jgi:hypothetical protein